jgi:hypothetical protein
MIASRPHSPASSAHSPRSPHFHSPASRSPYAHSSRSRSPFAGSSRPQSPADAAPFEGRFESARAAPKPPVRNRSQKSATTSSTSVSSQVDELSALPQRPGSSFARRGSAPDTGRSSSVKRSSSLLKRIRRGGSRDTRPESPFETTGKATAPKHERSMTSELADLFRMAGESPRTSRIATDIANKPNKVRKKNFNALGEVLGSPGGPSRQMSRKSSGRHLRATAATSPPADSAYSSGDGELSDGLERVDSGDYVKRSNSRRSANTANKSATSLVRAASVRSRSPTTRPPAAEFSSRVSPTPQADSASFSVTVDPASRPFTPTSRGKFGLFPTSRPMTPSGASVRSAGYAERLGSEGVGLPLSAGPSLRKGSLPNWPTIDRAAGSGGSGEGAPAPGVPRARQRSNAGMESQESIVEVYHGDKDKVESTGPSRKGSLKKKSSLSRLKKWIGRRAASPSSLREVQE